MTWQPIETAPMRRKVLVTWINELGNRRTTLAVYIEAGWFEDREAGDGLYYPLNEPITHWMPLPPAPEGDR